VAAAWEILVRVDDTTRGRSFLHGFTASVALLAER
jgi:hypothetical protein